MDEHPPKALEPLMFCTLAQAIRERKRLTHQQVAERAKLPVQYVRNLEVCKIHNPDAYCLYCLSFGLGNPFPILEERIDRLARTPLDDQDRPLRIKKKDTTHPSTPRRASDERKGR